MRAQPFDLQSREVAMGASIKPSHWSHAKDADKGRSHTRIDILGIVNLERRS
jgi:hypothetical protein